jgi:hypothetical protein
MKKIITLILCLLFLLQATAFAEIQKTVNHNGLDSIDMRSDYVFPIEENNKSIWISISRSGYFDKANTIPEEHVTYYTTINLAHSYKTPMSFMSGKIPFFTVVNDGIDTELVFKKIFTISNDSAIFNMNSKELKQILSADKIYTAIALKDGTTQKIEIPDDVLKEWKYIITCNLLDEYKKGI